MRLNSYFDLLPERAFQRGPSGRIMPQGGGKGGSSQAPAPDPSIGQAQLQMSNLAAQQYQDYQNNVWPVIQQQAADQQTNADAATKLAQDTAAQQEAIAQTQQTNANAVSAADLQAQKQQNDQAAAMYAQYNSEISPMMSSIVNDANNYNTAGNQEQQANYAIGDARTAYDNSMATQEANARSYGIDPTSGGYQAMEQAGGVNEAATEAAAATRARDAAVALGWQKKVDAVTLGNSMFTGANASATTGLNAGGAALATGTATVPNAQVALQASGQGVSTGQTGITNATTLGASYNQGTAGSGALYGSSGGLGANSYATQVSAWNAQQQANAQSAAGIGSAIGVIGGVGLKAALA